MIGSESKWLIPAVATALFTVPLAAQAGGVEPAAAKKPARPEIYDTSADAKEQIAHALKVANRDNKRVLLMFGGNWCGWCHKLHELYASDKAIAAVLKDDYQLVMIDIGKWDKHMDLAAGYGAKLKETGVPYLTLLAADGAVLTNQDTGSLEDGPNHDPKKVLGFLEKWKPEPADAEAVLAAGQKRAAKEQKLLFLHIGGPGCVWCDRLDAFMVRPEIAAILDKDFVDLKIDQDRMVHGAEVAARIRKGAGGGIPWFVFANAELEPLITSDGPKGTTIGFPVDDHEIEHFMAMLQKAKKNMTDEDLAQIEKALQASAEQVKAARKPAPQKQKQ